MLKPNSALIERRYKNSDVKQPRNLPSNIPPHAGEMATQRGTHAIFRLLRWSFSRQATFFIFWKLCV
jgi:hypothetical protein